MTKADVVDQIYKQTGIERAIALDVIGQFMLIVKNSLTNGEHVYIRGFGSFIVKERPERKARNITKNTTIVVPARRLPAFKPSKEFTNRLNEPQ